jgi:hypothetical protein
MHDEVKTERKIDILCSLNDKPFSVSFLTWANYAVLIALMIMKQTIVIKKVMKKEYAPRKIL